MAREGTYITRSFNVIYHMIDDLKNEISDQMPPVEVEDVVGRGTVLQEFMVSVDKKKVPVAGCKITTGQFDGSLSLSVSVRLIK